MAFDQVPTTSKTDPVAEQTEKLIADFELIGKVPASNSFRQTEADQLRSELVDKKMREDVQMLANDDAETFAAVKANLEKYRQAPEHAGFPSIEIEQGKRLGIYDHLNLWGRTTLQVATRSGSYSISGYHDPLHNIKDWLKK